jgi:hypothetical protein
VTIEYEYFRPIGVQVLDTERDSVLLRNGELMAELDRHVAACRALGVPAEDAFRGWVVKMLAEVLTRVAALERHMRN